MIMVTSHQTAVYSEKCLCQNDASVRTLGGRCRPLSTPICPVVPEGFAGVCHPSCLLRDEPCRMLWG